MKILQADLAKSITNLYAKYPSFLSDNDCILQLGIQLINQKVLQNYIGFVFS